MVKTGYISFITQGDFLFDADGNPLDPTKSYGVLIPCNIQTITKEFRTLVDGQYFQGNYSCYFDQVHVSRLDLSVIRQIRLCDNRKNVLGDFQIQNVEYLDIAKKIKLIV
jgi:hypothetical protein